MLPAWLQTVLLIVVPVVNYGAALAVTVHAVLWKRDMRAVIGWVGMAWLAPVVGPLAYLGFGINRIQRRAIALKVREQTAWKPDASLSELALRRADELAAINPRLQGLARLGENLNGRPLLPGNQVVTLVNGDQAFPEMLAAIDRAERSVALASYIFDSDRVGEMFFSALGRALGRGVQVRVLIDHVGASYSRPKMIRRLQQAAIPTSAFLPTRVPRSAKYANLRNHRKILVIDGAVAFAGGTNIREGHWLALNPDYPVQCVHFRLEGPVVAQLQEAFAIDWVFSSGESLQGEAWFPTLQNQGEIWARGVPDGPDEDFEKITHTLLGALASATQSVQIVTPYFLPQAPLTDALNVTALRGVDVDIVVPRTSNLPIVQWASTANFWQLLEKGCRIHLSEAPFDHSKLMVVDRMWSLIGSTNWDPAQPASEFRVQRRVLRPDAGPFPRSADRRQTDPLAPHHARRSPRAILPDSTPRWALAPADALPLNGLRAEPRPPHPAFGHLLPRWGEGTRSCHLFPGSCHLFPGSCHLFPDRVTSSQDRVTSSQDRHLPGIEIPARVPRAGAGRVRAEHLATGPGPLIRPSATFSRVGEKGHARVTSPGDRVTSSGDRVTSSGDRVTSSAASSSH